MLSLKAIGLDWWISGANGAKTKVNIRNFVGAIVAGIVGHVRQHAVGVKTGGAGGIGIFCDGTLIFFENHLLLSE